jgi:D-psicose/D-tagatose/L-ribulose 3-epimerase
VRVKICINMFSWIGPGQGHATLPETIAQPRAIDYRWLTIEALGSAVPELAAATRAWRLFFSDLESVCRDRYRFIRNVWDGAKA